jgi:hypothetical protein
VNDHPVTDRLFATDELAKLAREQQAIQLTV